MVVPVFYRVQPTDVQELGGNYKKSLYKLKKEHKCKLSRWCSALKTISNELSGWVSNEIKDDETLIQKIVDDVWEKLSHIPSNASCGDKLVGIDSRAEEVKSLMDVKVNGRRTIGICGMPGIGKTTLADKVYQHLKAGFDGHCFVSNVNDKITKEIPIVLRDKIIGELLRIEHLKISTPSLGDHIKRRLGSKKVLVVFDDVTVLNQLNVLAGDCNLYGEGSRIIVTCTDRRVLVNVCDREHIYEVKELTDDEALQLFCWFAFHRNDPIEGYVVLSNKVIRYAQGNPLALRVLGSNFCGLEIEDWESELAKLECIPDMEVLKVLRVSYEGLDRDAQRIFLDIACFLDRFQNSTVERILEGSGFFARRGIRRLLDKSLITETHDRVVTHNLLQQMGKEIVNEECKNPGGRSRLWSSGDILHVFKTNSGTENIEGISLDMRGIKSIELSPEAFSNMHSLRFLRFYGCYGFGHDHCSMRCILPNGLDFLPEQLTYINWMHYPLKFLPLKFCPKNLVELQLDYSHLVQLWWNKDEPFENLKVLSLHCCKSLKRISKSFQAPKLEELFLKECENLVEIPSLVSFERLEFLSLCGCKKLEECPDVPCNLRNLDLRGTPIKQLSSSIQNCCRLVRLSLESCTELEDLPDWIGQLESLETLWLEYCRKLSWLPESICQLTHLKLFSIEGCLKLNDLPSNFGELRSLKTLILGKSSIKTLPSSIFQLRNLECEGLTTLRPLTGLNSLVTLVLDYSSISEIPESICSLISMRELSSRQCERLRNLPELPKCLTVVDASGCTSLEFASCPSLSQEEEEDNNREVLINFAYCTNLNKEARLKIMEDALSYSNKKEFQLWIPGLELLPKMRYKASGDHISFELERHYRIVGFYFSVMLDPQFRFFYAINPIVCDVKFVDTFGETHHFSYPAPIWWVPGGLSSEHVLVWYRTFDHKEHSIFTQASFKFGCQNTGLWTVPELALGSGRVIGCGVEPKLEYLSPEEELVQMVEDH